jgi:hypothetical protein
MSTRTLVLGLVAAAALVVGAAVSFFELIIVGILAAIAAVVFAVRDRRDAAAA